MSLKSEQFIEPFVQDSKSLLVLLELSERESRKERTFSSDLLNVIPTYSKLLKIYDTLSSAGFIKISHDEYGNNRKLISLTIEGKLFLYGLEAVSQMIETYRKSCDETDNFLKEGGLEEHEEELRNNPPEPMTAEELEEFIRRLELRFEAMHSALINVRFLKLGLIDNLEYAKRKSLSPLEVYHYLHEKDILTPEEQELAKDISKLPYSKDEEDSHNVDSEESKQHEN